jgi:hypothetical protein
VLTLPHCPSLRSLLCRYCRVDEDSCCLLIGKTKDSQNPTSIDLKLVVEMKAYEKVRKGRERGRGVHLLSCNCPSVHCIALFSMVLLAVSLSPLLN